MTVGKQAEHRPSTSTLQSFRRLRAHPTKRLAALNKAIQDETGAEPRCGAATLQAAPQDEQSRDAEPGRRAFVIGRSTSAILTFTSWTCADRITRICNSNMCMGRLGAQWRVAKRWKIRSATVGFAQTTDSGEYRCLSHLRCDVDTFSADHARPTGRNAARVCKDTQMFVHY